MSPTRRAYLRAGLGIGVVTLAGCATRSGNGSTATGETRRAETDAGPFKQLSFEGGDLVVALTPDHGLSGVNLIAPDGTIFGQASIATGVEAVRIPVLDPQPDDGGYRHYTPGVHELVGFDAEGDEAGTRTVPMEPEIELIGVEQYRTGDRATDFGSLVVTFENTGTAPTWVYDITYRDAPNFAANVDISDNPGVSLIRTVPNEASPICDPDDRRIYADVTPPLALSGQQAQPCTGEFSFSVILGLATGVVLQERITASLSGDSTEFGLTDQYVCSNIDIVRDESNATRSKSITAQGRYGDAW